MLEIDRNNCENRFNTIFNEVKLVASKIDLEFKVLNKYIVKTIQLMMLRYILDNHYLYHTWNQL